MGKNNSGRRFDQKLKPYLVFQYLMKYSDENNVVSAKDIVDYLSDIGISAERRSIYKDIQEINRAICITENSDNEEKEYTLDDADKDLEDEEERVVVYDPNKKGYYVKQRHYDLEDVRILAECVYAAKFIDEKRAKNLVEVLCGLVSDNQAKTIRHNVYSIDRIKTPNTQVHYNITNINDAMSTSLDGEEHTPEKISFKYLKYTIQNVKQQVERKGGERYIVSPYQLLINEGNYYLLAFDDKSKDIRTFRVDRMKDIKLIGEWRDGEKEFAKIDLTTYTQRMFSMFNGYKEIVTMRFVASLLDTVVERFGTNPTYISVDKHHFTISAQVEVSNQFFGWICGFGRSAVITNPPTVVEQFTQYVKRIGDLYD